MAIVKISDLPLVDSPVEGTDLFVVVQDNVTKKAYASDIQTYVGFEEFQTATAGQTVFNLTTMTYAAGANNLQVFVDGVNQYVGTSYLETDNNTVTFTQGLHQGALVKFATVQTLSTVDTSSANILFTQGGTGAVTRSVQSKERDIVSVKDFGAVGDGVADDTAAFVAALATGKSVFIPDGIYCITSQLTVSTPGQMIYGLGYSKSIVQRGNDSSFDIFYVSAAYGAVFRNFKIQEINVSQTNTGSFITLPIGGGTDVVIEGMWFWYGNVQVRCLQGTSNITFSNTVFETARKGAIFSSSSVRNKIIGCTFWKNSADFSNPADRGYAIFLAKDGTYSFGSDNWNIVGNYFAENVYGPFLIANSSEGLQIVGNFFEIPSQVDNGQKSDMEFTSCTRISITGNVSDSIINSYSPSSRGCKYVVDLSGGGNSNIVIGANQFEPGVLGTINDPSRVVDPMGSYSIALAMPVQINSSGAGITMSAQIGLATRVGKTVTVSAQTTLTNKGAGSGVVRLGPLPYTPSSTGLGFGSGYITGSSGITTPIYFQFSSDGYVYPLFDVSTNVLNTNITNTSQFVFSGTYQIA
jgi:hypothetical protein